MSLLFLPSSLCLFPSPFLNHPNLQSYDLSFYLSISIVVTASVKQRHRTKVKNTKQVLACANQNQFTQTITPKNKQSNAFIWRETIRDYVKNGLWEKALRLYYQMQRAGIEPDKLVFIYVINSCSSLSDLQAGMKIHEDIIARGFESDVFVGTALASMYAKCGSLDSARQVFEKMPERNVVSWTAIIGGYLQQGYPHEALALFTKMQVQGVQPNAITIINVIGACTDLLALEQGKQIHGYTIRSRFESNIILSTGLVDLYTKCGNVKIAYKLFERIPEKNVVSWTAIIAGYAQNNMPHESLAIFSDMQVQGIEPNSFTIGSVLPACADLFALEHGKQIHCYAIRNGFESEVVVGTGLVDMYTKCGNVNIAHKLFERMPDRDVVLWNAIIAGYSQNGHPREALAFFNEMLVQGIKPDSFALASVLSACAHFFALEQGKQIHGVAIRSGFESDVIVGTGLLNVYAKCGNVAIAHKLFERLPGRDVASWTAIIGGYSQNGHHHEALAFFIEMQGHGIKPDSITLAGVLPACSNLMALEQGKQIHNYAIRNGFGFDVAVVNALVYLYAKCGHVGIAQQVFDNVSSRDIVSWNAMILAHGIHGQGADALALFSLMQQTGIKPDHITFTAVLTACSHAALVNQGRQYFESMKSDYDLAPKLEQYACLVDLLGRAGDLHEAHDIINKMPLEPDANVWGALLGACRVHYNIELAEQAAKQLFELEPNNAGNYILLSNIYADACRWEDVVRVRTMMKERGVKKQPGCSSVEVHRAVHTFLVGDRTHPQSEKIYAMLETLYEQMKKLGYVPNTNLVLHDVEDEVKENILCSHSEKLAISFGIINTSPGTPIRIMKNLRVCNDCHNATTFISKIVGREIIVRDANRFHHFKAGLCSCGGYW